MGRLFPTQFEYRLDRANKQTALLRYIEERIEIYNRQAKKDEDRIAAGRQPYRLDERQKLLNQIQRSVYRWIAQNPSSHRKNAALDLLDDVQREHLGTIKDGLAARRGFKLYADGIANRREQRQLDDMWRELVSGTGKIRISEVDPLTVGILGEVRIPGFKEEILAAFARLLALPRGRRVVQKMLNQSKTVTVVPMNPLSNLILKEPGGYSAPTDDEDLHTANMTSQGEKLKQMVDRRHNPVGSDVTIGILPGLRDSKIWLGGMYPSDVENFHELHSPVFLILAHELLHAKHQIRGRDRGNVIGNYDLSPAISFTNAEELRVIETGKTSENKFRRDLDLGMRVGHNLAGERA